MARGTVGGTLQGKLKDLQLRNATAEQSELLLSDGGNLFLRVRPNGGKDWLFIYMFEGRRRKLGLGPYPGRDLSSARQAAYEYREQIAKGVDPADARELAKIEAQADLATAKAKAAENAARPTVSKLLELWAEDELSRRKDKGEESLRALRKDLLPTLGDRFAAEVKRRDVMMVLDSIRRRGANRLANRTLKDVRQMFGWALVREIVEGDPTSRIEKKDVGGKEVERERVLSPAEIRTLAAALPESGLSTPATAALWIMLSTCGRVGELSRTRWPDVDLDARTWRIPAENSKNGRPHLIHLSEFAVEHFTTMLERRIRREREGAPADSLVWVFPARFTSIHVCPKTFQKQFSDRQRDDAPMSRRSAKTGTLKLPGGEWRAHDLRRTGATMMGDLGIRPDVIDRCLNHVDAKLVTRTYQRQELLPERAEAFRQLGERLELLTRPSGGNVVTLHKLPADTAG
ncbi:MAG: tyrosine-type recombinase/integrase [Gammaproteobacteria bacterium]|nr:tyrosine-type recombinase/integrase [Gammaproteobacteria bacterium]